MEMMGRQIIGNVGMRTEAERLRRDKEKLWENEWWNNIAEEAEKAEKLGDACGSARTLRSIHSRGGKTQDAGGEQP